MNLIVLTLGLCSLFSLKTNYYNSRDYSWINVLSMYFFDKIYLFRISMG